MVRSKIDAKLMQAPYGGQKRAGKGVIVFQILVINSYSNEMKRIPTEFLYSFHWKFITFY